MEIGAEVWVRDDEGDECWLTAVIVTKNHEDGTSAGMLSVRCESGKLLRFRVTENSEEDYHNVKLRNGISTSSTDNLIDLPHLHEAAMLHCIEERYKQSKIYTFTGPILIAVNPFKNIGLYSPSILESYYNAGLLRAQSIPAPASTSVSSTLALAPHIYSIADGAYRSMMNAITQHQSSTSAGKSLGQTILISGESGAGKTESTKIVLRYLTTVGNASSGLQVSTGSIMDKVLQSNPILESFGNARTVRNDNSSRFGKFIELNFSRRGHLIGGVIRTYLLEKIRLTSQQGGERNFHVFYQLLAGCSPQRRKELSLSSARDFRYTNQGGIFELRMLDDRVEYGNLMHAMDTLGISPSDVDSLMALMAAILHLGELEFTELDGDDGDGCCLSASAVNDNHIHKAAELLGLSVNELTVAFTSRKIVTRQESIVKALNPVQAATARDALARVVYDNVFKWLVGCVNASILVEDSSLKKADIGVLDIFGFECFHTNSFEQLCINYTNEALQQQFNQFIFKMEQEEYEKEKIKWSFIQFPDNQECLELIDHKQYGILAMLDDECKLPKATDEKLASRLYKTLESHPRFAASAKQKRDMEFTVRHFAGLVNYSATNFIEKNKDELPKESTNLLCSSSSSLVSSIFASYKGPDSDHISDTKSTGASAAVVSSSSSSMSGGVGLQFKVQLSKLMEKIQATMPHYIRCLKPNDDNLPDRFIRLRATEQLRYGGVLEAVRVARSGFPVRLKHAEFYQRYQLLDTRTQAGDRLTTSSSSSSSSSSSELCHTLMDSLCVGCAKQPPEASGESAIKSRRARGLPSAFAVAARGSKCLSRESVQIGLSKVFLRKEATDMLESWRSATVCMIIVCVQARYRCYVQRSKFLRTVTLCKLIQRNTRGFIARKTVASMRQHAKSICIQTWWRSRFLVHTYAKLRFRIIAVQTLWRGCRCRTLYQQLRQAFYAVILQKIARGLVPRRRFLHLRRSIVSLQCFHRRRIAQAVLAKLLAAAKDMGILKQSNEALKQEIAELRLRAKEEVERASNVAMTEELQRLKDQLTAAYALLDEERKLHRQTDLRLTSAVAELEKTKAVLAEQQQQSPSSEGGDKKKMSYRPPQRKSTVTAPSSPTMAGSSSPRIRARPLPSFNEIIEKNVTKVVVGENLQRQSIGGDATAPSGERSKVAMKLLSPPSSSSSSSSLLPTITPGRDAASLLAALEEERLIRKSLEDKLSSFEARLKEKDAIPRFPIQYVKNNKETGNGTETAAVLHGLSPHISPHDALGNEVAEEAAIGKFMRNVESFRMMLQSGVHAVIWEFDYAAAAAAAEANPKPKAAKCDDYIVRLDGANRIVFSSTKSSSRYSLFSSKAVEVAPVSVRDVFECQPGGGADMRVQQVPADDDCFITIVVKPSLSLTAAGQSSGAAGLLEGRSRHIIMKLGDREEASEMLIAIRTLVSDLHLHMHNHHCNGTVASTPNRSAERGKTTTATTAAGGDTPTTTHTMMMTPQKGGFSFNSMLRNMTTTTPYSDKSRESRGHDNYYVDATTSTPNKSVQNSVAHRTTPTGPMMQNIDVGGHQHAEEASVLKQQLQVERTNYERLMMQLLALTNDLNERESEIIEYKKREAALKQTLAANENSYQEDSEIRLVLGKRLEQVLIDKEEALQQLELMEEKLESVRCVRTSREGN